MIGSSSFESYWFKSLGCGLASMTNDPLTTKKGTSPRFRELLLFWHFVRMQDN